MNKWKIAFFVLLFILILVGGIIYWKVFAVSASAPIEETPLNMEEKRTLQVQTTREDFEAIANTYMQRAIPKDTPIDVDLRVENEIILSGEVPFFTSLIPVSLYFDPVPTKEGNLMLNQTKLEVGRLNVSPRAVLKVIRDTESLPKWMEVQPKEERIFIHLDRIPFANGIEVRVNNIDLPNDHIQLDVAVPVGEEK
ncbi:MAG TPA: YpmS family protein [Savagea sp.]